MSTSRRAFLSSLTASAVTSAYARDWSGMTLRLSLLFLMC